MKQFTMKKFILASFAFALAMVCWHFSDHITAGFIAAGVMHAMALPLPGLNPSTGTRKVTAQNMNVSVSDMMALTGSRDKLDYLKARYPKATVISESYLRMENALSNTANSYQFNIVPNAASDSGTEKKLNQNDLFGVTHVGVFLGQRNSVAKANAMQLQTFPCDALLDGATANVVITDLFAIYNGSLQIAIGTVIFFDAIEGLDFLYIPVTQQDTVTAAATSTSSTPAAPPGAAETVATFTPLNNQRNKDSGMVELSTLLILSGQAQNYFTYNLPLPQTPKFQAVTAGVVNCIILKFRGFIVKGQAYMDQMS